MPTIDEHRASPHISIDRYEKARIVQLGRALESRAAIYLDVRFWILLRQASINSNANAAEYELLVLLRSLVAEGKAFCPISETTFIELMKQTDPRSRQRTASLIDELSLGVALIPYDRRIATEIAHFFHSFDAEKDALLPLNHLVWSKLSYVMGTMHPEPHNMDAETTLAIQKSFLDRMWSMTLAEVVATIGDGFPGEDSQDAHWAEVLNEGVSEHAHELKSFEQTLDAELRGAVDFSGDLIMDVIAAKAEGQNVTPPEKGSPQYLRSRSAFQNVVYLGLKKRPQVRKLLPSLFIEACLHAAFRWDKKRRFKPNDMHDFHHACAALAYCDVFLTEGPLNTLLETRHLALN